MRILSSKFFLRQNWGVKDAVRDILSHHQKTCTGISGYSSRAGYIALVQYPRVLSPQSYSFLITLANPVLAPKNLLFASRTRCCLAAADAPGATSSIPCTGVNARLDDRPELAPDEGADGFKAIWKGLAVCAPSAGRRFWRYGSARPGWVRG